MQALADLIRAPGSVLEHVRAAHVQVRLLTLLESRIR
jgi:hypothetical protein